MKKLALHWKIIIGLVLGVIYGLIASNAGWGEFTQDWIKPWGGIFVKSLKMIAVPLVMVSLINGVASLSDISRLSKIGGKTVLIYLFTTVVAVSIGLLSVNIWKPWESITPEMQANLIESFSGDAVGKIQIAEQTKEAGPLQFLEDMVPSNIFNAMAESSMLQVIVFAVLFGVALIMIPKEKSQPVAKFFDGVNEIILKIVDVIMLLAPYGTFALLGSLITDIAKDDPQQAVDLLATLGWYGASVVSGLLVMGFGAYPALLYFFTKYPIIQFFKAIAPAQLLAFSTSSSAATLPVTMERSRDAVGVSEEVTSFVLPLGATINMDGTSLYQAVAAVFISFATGFELTFANQLSIVLTATLASIGSAAVPGAGMVMLVIVLAQLGVPTEGLALILGVDRILDMCRTVVNVTGDATVATIIAKMDGQLNPPQER